MPTINHKKMYAIYRRVDEMQKYYRRLCNVYMLRIYKQVADEFGYVTPTRIIDIYTYVHKNRHKYEFKMEKLLYEEKITNYSNLYSSEEDKKNIEKLKNAKDLIRFNKKSEWHYYIYKRYEDLSENSKGIKKSTTGIYMDIADEFLLRNHISAYNIITAVKKILNS